MKVKSVLVSQPRPAVIEKSPFYELSQKHHVEIAYRPFIRVEGVSLKEFRAQRVEILTHTAVIFTSRTTVDSFFHICEEARITVPETMKYICQTEAVALYLQKYIVYRKRKISFADGSFTNPTNPSCRKRSPSSNSRSIPSSWPARSPGIWTTLKWPTTTCWRSIRPRT